MDKPLTCPTGMLSHKGRGKTERGCTLIELLVVVLIIGILAAVAVPQYKVAVAKSRITKLKINMEAVVKAQKIYYLANGEFSNDADKLDITVDPIAVGCNLSAENQMADCWSQRIEGLRYNCALNGPAGTQNCYCVSPKDNTLTESICKSQGELTALASDSYHYYTVNY